MSGSGGTPGGRRDFEAATETSKVTATVEITGALADVLKHAKCLLQHVVNDLDNATLLTLRAEYGPASPPSYVADPGRQKAFEMVGWDVRSPAEAGLWELALRASERPTERLRGS